MQVLEASKMVLYNQREHVYLHYNAGENKVDDKGAKWLSKTHWPKLQHLHLGSNLITSEGCKDLKRSDWTNLVHFDLGISLTK
jgi:hypothetical protein